MIVGYKVTHCKTVMKFKKNVLAVTSSSVYHGACHNIYFHGRILIKFIIIIIYYHIKGCTLYFVLRSSALSFVFLYILIASMMPNGIPLELKPLMRCCPIKCMTVLPKQLKFFLLILFNRAILTCSVPGNRNILTHRNVAKFLNQPLS